jgi:hypothetical protein
MTLKQTIRRNLSNLPGWSTTRKIAVIESDDWGSIRMPSTETYESLREKGIDIESGDNFRFNKYDSLATSHDLELLFDTLSKVKDKTGRAAVFTPVSIVANPDFEKIKKSGFEEYFYEPFAKTLKRIRGCESSFRLWEEGINNRLFVPQFHGREHLNVQVWMRALRDNDNETHVAFDHGIWGYNNINPHGIFYNAAFHPDNPEELEYHKHVISDGLKVFYELLGYKAEYFVPPNGPVNNLLFKTASENGIRYISASKIQNETLGNGITKKHFHWTGQKTSYGQYCLTRNCFFEPSADNHDWVSSCLNDINTAFRWGKAAVVSSHRVNYIGALYPENRDRGLRELKSLLREMVNRWPDLEFMTSKELGDLISAERGTTI